MEMTRIEASVSIIEWDSEASRMLVLNPGDVGEAGSKLASVLCTEKRAKKTGKAIRAGEPEMESGADENEVDAPIEDTAEEPEAEATAADDEAPAADAPEDEAPAA